MDLAAKSAQLFLKEMDILSSLDVRPTQIEGACMLSENDKEQRPPVMELISGSEVVSAAKLLFWASRIMLAMDILAQQTDWPFQSERF